MEYELMIPPFKHDGFNTFTKAEAKEYFEWYINQKEHRVKLLQNYLIKNNVMAELDYSPESLVPLWAWYEENIVVEKKSELEIKKENEKHPEWMEPFLSENKISIETLKYAMDIAIYFAEVLIKHSDGKLYWGYVTKPKKFASVNRPVVIGFKAKRMLDPRRVVYNCTWKSVENRDCNKLHEMYNIWREGII